MSSSLVGLSDDLVRHVGLLLDFDALRALFATCSHFSDITPAVWQSRSWRAIPCNEAALQGSAWTSDDETETCLGAYGGQASQVSFLRMHDSRVAIARTQQTPLDGISRTVIKLWDVGGSHAHVTHTIPCPRFCLTEAARIVDVKDLAISGHLVAVSFGQRARENITPLDRCECQCELFDLRTSAGSSADGAPQNIEQPGVPLAHSDDNYRRGGAVAMGWAGERLITIMSSAAREEQLCPYTLHSWLVPSATPSAAVHFKSVPIDGVYPRDLHISSRYEGMILGTTEDTIAVRSSTDAIPPMRVALAAVDLLDAHTLVLQRHIDLCSSARGLRGLSSSHLAVQHVKTMIGGDCHRLELWPLTSESVYPPDPKEEPNWDWDAAAAAAAVSDSDDEVAKSDAVAAAALDSRRRGGLAVSSSDGSRAHTMLPPGDAALTHTLVSVAISAHLLVASFRHRDRQGARVVCLWGVWSRALLRTIELPTYVHTTLNPSRFFYCVSEDKRSTSRENSRQHAHFHPNVIVQNSLSGYGAHIALDGYRLALTAQVKPGDWREELPGGDCAERRTMLGVGGAHSNGKSVSSLLVVQEVGPDWLRDQA